MAKLTKSSIFKTPVPLQETPMDKTTRIVRKMTDDDAEKRQIKIDRLRKARLEREKSTPASTSITKVKSPARNGAKKR